VSTKYDQITSEDKRQLGRTDRLMRYTVRTPVCLQLPSFVPSFLPSSLVSLGIPSFSAAPVMSGHGHRGQYYHVQGYADPHLHTSHSFDPQQGTHSRPRPTDGLRSYDSWSYGYGSMVPVPAIPTQSSRYHPYPRTPPPPLPNAPSNPGILRPVPTRALTRDEVSKLIGPSITDSLGISDSRRARGPAVDDKIPTHVSNGRPEATGRNNAERRSQGDVKVDGPVARRLSKPGYHSRPRGETREEHLVPAEAHSIRAACLSDVPVLPESIPLDSCSSSLDHSASRLQTGEGSSPQTFSEADCRDEWAPPGASRSSV
jgi:hypothetical protein